MGSCSSNTPGTSSKSRSNSIGNCGAISVFMKFLRLFVRELYVLFQDLTGRDLPTNQLGFATLEALLISLSGVVDMVYKGKGKLKYYQGSS